MKNKTGKNIKWHYAWVIVILIFAVLLINAGVRSIPSIIMKPLETEFNWSRAHVSAAIAVSFVTFGLSGPLGGKLVDKYNSKAVMITIIIIILGGFVMKMNINQCLLSLRQAFVKKALPVLSFPGMQMINITVDEMVSSGHLHA